MARYLYSELAGLIDARRRCMATDANEFQKSFASKHEDTIEHMVKDFMPSGSGFNSGTLIDFDASHAGKLVFTTSYQHMNDAGYYDGWTEHTVIVTPSLQSKFNLRITGRNRNDIKDYMYQTFEQALTRDVEYAIWQYTYDTSVKPVWENGSIARWIAEVVLKAAGAGTVTTNGVSVPCDKIETVATGKREDVEHAAVEYIRQNAANVVRRD